MADRISTDQRSKLMSRVKNKNTDIEILLRKILWKNNLRYRLHYKIYGSPDIAIPKKKMAIFCDGDFWHGKNYETEGHRYNKFWKEKIKNNIRRDRLVKEHLEKDGWAVLRFWRSEILKDLDRCYDIISGRLASI